MWRELPYCHWLDGKWHAGYKSNPIAFPEDIDPKRIPAPIADIGQRIRFRRKDLGEKIWIGEVLEVYIFSLDCDSRKCTYTSGLGWVPSETDEPVERHYYSGEKVHYLLRAPAHSYLVDSKDVIGLA